MVKTGMLEVGMIVTVKIRKLEIVGKITELSDNDMFYLVDSKGNQWKFYSDIHTVLPNTKLKLCLAIQNLVKENNIQDMYFLRYFSMEKTVKQMMNISKSTLENLYSQLVTR